METSMEDLLDQIIVKRRPLDLTALVFVVEGNGLTGGVDGDACLWLVVFV